MNVSVRVRHHAFVAALGRSLFRLTGLGAIAFLTASPVFAGAPVKDPTSPPDIPFERYFIADEFGRQIAFYLETAPAQSPPLPIALFILGSGAHSNFLVREGRALHAHRTFLKALDRRARLLIVEKVGVPFGAQPDRPGTAVGSSALFRKEHTFERWVAANSAALNAARTIDGIDMSRTLVVGHSEGAIVAAGVSARNSYVTHVACLAGQSATQLFSFVQEARAGRLTSMGETPARQMAELVRQWEDIAAHRDDPDRMWLGHAYPRWSSFLSHSIVEELQRSRARVFMAVGSEDGLNPEGAVDLLRATLLSKGKQEVTAWVIPGADHGFQFSADRKRDGWGEILKQVSDWFASTSGHAPR